MGQTVVDIGVDTMYRFRATVQIFKINSMISKEEQTLKNLYMNIGKTYTCSDDSLENMLSEVKECKQKISDGEKQKLVLRKLRRCEQCGALISNIATFCGVCGNKMIVAEEKDTCLHCGSSVEKGMRFCTECGKPMPNVATPQKNLRVCPACGKSLKKKDLFCTECGTKID